jgi:putative FmdB family regulatory protein
MPTPEQGNGSRCEPAGGATMPRYEYHCEKCQRAVTLILSIGEHEKGKVKSPKCGSKALQPLLSTFASQTPRKS